MIHVNIQKREEYMIIHIRVTSKVLNIYENKSKFSNVSWIIGWCTKSCLYRDMHSWNFVFFLFENVGVFVLICGSMHVGSLCVFYHSSIKIEIIPELPYQRRKMPWKAYSDHHHPHHSTLLQMCIAYDHMHGLSSKLSRLASGICQNYHLMLILQICSSLSHNYIPLWQ